MKLKQSQIMFAILVLVAGNSAQAESPAYDFLTSQERVTLEQLPQFQSDLVQKAGAYRKNLAQDQSVAHEQKIVEITKKVTELIGKILEVQAVLPLLQTVDNNNDKKEVVKNALNTVQKDVDALKKIIR
jgi:hypothetical protein